jgi:outer membrane receptor for ferrienterochelin and colicins
MTRLLPALWLGAALAVVSSAHAQSDAELAEILNESIVTTASQTAETASTAPATSTTISADDLRRYGIHTVEEAVNFLSLGVSSAGGRSSASITELGSRGVLLPGDSGSHFLMLIDGHSVNEPFFGSARFGHLAGITLEMVDRIEVIVGPGSVLYGSNAMLCVINIITKNTDALRGGRLVGELEFPVSRRAAALGGVPLRIFGEKAEFTVAVQYWDEYGPDFDLGPQNVGLDTVSERPTRTRRGGPEDGIWGGVASTSSYARVPSGMLRLRVGDLELSLRGRIAEWGLPFYLGDFDDELAREIERSASADIEYRALLSPEFQLTTRLYADTYDNRQRAPTSRVSSCPFLGSTTCVYEKSVAARWAGAEIQGSYDWFRDGSFNTLLGFDGRLRFAGSKYDVSDLDTGRAVLDSEGVVDENDQIFGAYLQQTWLPMPRLGFNAGARLDRDPRFPAVVSPRAAVSVGTFPGNTLKVVYSEAFRAPSFEESDFTDVVRARPEDLRPETVRSIEGSIEQRFGAHRVLFGAFHSWWKDMVQFEQLTYEEALAAVDRGLLDLAIPNTAYFQFQNASSIKSYGFNAALEGSFVEERFRYGLNVTEAHSLRQVEGGSRVLAAAPQFFGNARVSYDFGAALPTLAFAGYLLGDRPAAGAFTSGFRPTPFAPVQIDLRLTATGDLPMVPGLSYRLSGDYLIGNEGPYVIGPVTTGTPENPSAELSPLPRYRVAIGLEYAFFDD